MDPTETANLGVGAKSRGPKPKKLQAAQKLLTKLLANNTEVALVELQAAAKATGISNATLNVAAKALGIKRRKDGFAGGWKWSLTNSASSSEAAPHNSTPSINPAASLKAPSAEAEPSQVDQLRMYYWLEPESGDSKTSEAREIIAGLMWMVAGRNANALPVTRFCQLCENILHNERGCAKGCPCHEALTFLGVIE